MRLSPLPPGCGVTGGCLSVCLCACSERGWSYRSSLLRSRPVGLLGKESLGQEPGWGHVSVSEGPAGTLAGKTLNPRPVHVQLLKRRRWAGGGGWGEGGREVPRHIPANSRGLQTLSWVLDPMGC